MSKYGMSKEDRVALMLVAAHLADTFADVEVERLAKAVESVNATIQRLAGALGEMLEAYDVSSSACVRAHAALASVTRGEGE